MGWNDARFLLVPPGWRLTLANVPAHAKSIRGPLQVVDVAPCPDSPRTLRRDAVRSYLTEHGFDLDEVTVDNELLSRDGTRLQVNVADGLVAQLLLEFKVTK